MSALLLVAALQLAGGQTDAVTSSSAATSSAVVSAPPVGEPPVTASPPPDSASPTASRPIQPAPIAAAGAGEQGAILVTGSSRHAREDPFQGVNVESYAVTQSVDRAVVGPVAMGYRRVVPQPVREGLHNALMNLREPTIFLNYMVQLNPGMAAATVGRFVINSTVGVAGLVDVAASRRIKLRRHFNGFADSFGYYGVGPGPYMFLPLVGPTTLRDLIGGGMDRLVLPLAVGAPFNKLAYTIPTGVVSALDHRVEIDEHLRLLRTSPGDPYIAMRVDYLARRKAEIDGLKGIKAPD